MPNNTTSRSPSLRSVLRLDATASGAMGVLLALAASPLATLLGLPRGLLGGAGAVLVPFAGFLFWLAPRATGQPAAVRAVIAANAAWVIASGGLIAARASSLTLLGELFVLLQAVVVAGFAYLEHRGLGRERISARQARTLPGV